MTVPEFLQGELRTTVHHGSDDLLSAGLGLTGLAGTPSLILNPLAPTALELRRRAIQSNWQGTADLGPLGGFGHVYGAVPNVPGREFQAFARIPSAHAPHRVLLQLPDAFDTQRRCLVVAASSGSRGIYGAIALAGAWGLPRGCAVAYTDKGAGSGYFDDADDSGVMLDGRRARRGQAMLEFEPSPGASGLAIKHLHSGDNPQADWGRHVIQAARFGLSMLDRAYPELAPFTPQNTTIIAVGLSNGGGAVLQAAGLNKDRLFAGVVALEPNVYVPGCCRPLFDYATEAAIWLPAALTAPRFAAISLARDAAGQSPIGWTTRAASLQAQGLVKGDTAGARGEAAYRHLRDAGWTDEAMATAAATTAFDLWRALAAGYASAYLRRAADAMPCGFRYAALAPGGVADAITRALWWANGTGIPPGDGIGLLGGIEAAADPTWKGCQQLRTLWTGDGDESHELHASVAATAAQLPRADLPLWIVHGAADGLLPIAFSSGPYVDWLRVHGRQSLHWPIPHAQHFDAFLALPGFGDRYVPLLPYGYAALDRLWRHLYEGQPWPSSVRVPAAQPRGLAPLTRAQLALS